MAKVGHAVHVVNKDLSYAYMHIDVHYIAK